MKNYKFNKEIIKRYDKAISKCLKSIRIKHKLNKKRITDIEIHLPEIFEKLKE